MNESRLISKEYRELNKQLHESRPDYGAFASKWAGQVASLAEKIKAQSILDYGCGKRSLEAGLKQVWHNVPVVQVTPYDPALDLLDKKPCDLVACLDVLEHIEPKRLDDVLDDLKDMTLKVGFFTIATRPAKKFLPDGRNAHLIQENYQWWLPRLWRRFRITAFQNFNDKEFLVIVDKL